MSQPTNGSSSTDASSEIEGIRVQAFVGLFADGEKEMDDGKHSYAATHFLMADQ